MVEKPGSLEEFWEYLLSRQPKRVRVALTTLNKHERQAVLAHLRRMVSEPGWQSGQRESARVALEVLEVLGAPEELKTPKDEQDGGQ